MTATVTPPASSQIRLPDTPVVRSSAARRVIAGLRIVIGWSFLWAFMDKPFALGFSTEAGNGWIHGNSPTTGYLMGASEGWFGSLWSALAGNPIADWLFMLGLLGLGVAAIAGIGLRIAAVAGVLLATFMYLSQLPLTGATNPHLRFNYWHDIEEDWDYDFVEVSTDGGNTWSQQKIFNADGTLASTDDNYTDPNGRLRDYGGHDRVILAQFDRS
jgi:hypothetical protein